MERTPVSSSNIASIGYDADSMTLEIEFLNGRIYQYAGVPADVHAALMAAGSHGAYFNSSIKNAYTAMRV
jgi:hypothetical protein